MPRAVVIGAGATGPRLRVASLRLGVGLPLGAVVPNSLAALSSGPISAVCSDTSESDARALSFFRPSRFTAARLLPIAEVPGGAWGQTRE